MEKPKKTGNVTFSGTVTYDPTAQEPRILLFCRRVHGLTIDPPPGGGATPTGGQFHIASDEPINVEVGKVPERSIYMPPWVKPQPRRDPNNPPRFLVKHQHGRRGGH